MSLRQLEAGLVRFLGVARCAADETRLQLPLSAPTRAEGRPVQPFVVMHPGTSSATQDVFASVSDDQGLTWGAPVRVDLGDAPNATDSEESKVVITADGTIVCIFEDKRDAAANGAVDEDLFYNRSTDGGVTWMPTSLALNSTTAGSDVTSDIDRPFVSVSGNSVSVTWEENWTSGSPSGNEELWFTRSEDAGATWSAPAMYMMPSTTIGVNSEPPVSAPLVALAPSG